VDDDGLLAVVTQHNGSITPGPLLCKFHGDN